MARVKSVFIFLFIFLASITAQNTSTIEADSVKLWTVRYLSADNDTSLLYRSIINTVPADQTMKKRTILVKALKQLSTFHESEGSLDSAIYFLNAVVNIQNEDDEAALAETYLSLKTLYGNKANYLAAQEQVFTALEIYEKLGDQKGVALCYTHLCDLLYYEDKYQESIDYCDRAINIQQSLKEKIDLALSYQYKASSQLFADSPLDSALNNINRAIDIYSELGENGVPLLASINGRGNILKYMERYSSALADYQEVYRRSEEMGLERYTIPALGNIGHVYTLEKNYSEALPYFLRAIER
ncbi:MAG: tetratricopeptide repeat protein, partial [Saprospiraceae bacterium]|nr:tetratricopeptide repeat protein [Saprospiraceae bacterium]